MHFTHHAIREGEQKGKASNVSWCVERVEEEVLGPNGIGSEEAMVTIMDVDSWAP